MTPMAVNKENKRVRKKSETQSKSSLSNSHACWHSKELVNQNGIRVRKVFMGNGSKERTSQ